MNSFWGKVSGAMKTVGALVSPDDGPPPKQPYRVKVTLDVVARNKRELEHAIKSAHEKLDKIGYELVAQAIGIGGNAIKCVGLSIDIEKSEA